MRSSASPAPPSQSSPVVAPLLLLILLAALVLPTRLTLAPRYLFSFDAVNFALALEDFDPRRHQPQPPGYPFFVAEARLLNLFFRNPERTFLACSLLAGVTAPLLLFFLGWRMYSRWAGVAAALLLAMNPVFWFSTLTSPVRPYLAVVTTLVAYLCHRAAGGEPRFAYYSAVALGLGGGWRPAAMVLLFPLWLFCAWRGLRSPRRLALGWLLAAAAALTWFVPLMISSGGPSEMWNMFASYLGEQSEGSSPVYGGGFWGWWKMVTQAFVWHALAVVGWFWAALLTLLPRREPGFQDPRSNQAAPVPHWAFVLLWVGPAAVFFALIHVASPGHTLSVVPALCLLGGACLERGARRLAELAPRLSPQQAPRWAFLALAMAIDVAFFIYPFRIPHERPQVRGTLAQVKEQFRFWGYFALRHSSFAAIRAEALRTGDRIRFLRGLGAASDLVIIWQDDDVSWRKITYYFPGSPLWVLEGISGPNRVALPSPRLWRGNRIVEARGGQDSEPLPLPSSGRVAWLLHLHSPFPEELRAQGVPLRQFGTMFLTDLSSAPSQFRAGSFLFQKQAAAP